jgi:hypothetical protein
MHMKNSSLGCTNRWQAAKKRRTAVPASLFSAILRILTIGYIAGLILMTEQRARAYVDPGSGLLMLQMLGASVAGGLFFLRQRLRKLFRSGTKDSGNTPSVPGLTKGTAKGPAVSPRQPDEL